jgi:RNA polymerase sigma-B factor
VACVGLLKAIDRYDPAHGVAFTSYALPTMRGELLRHFRDRAWSVRPPRDLQEQALLVERTTTELLRTLQRSPTIAEIADRAGLDAETVLEAREALWAYSAVSFSAPSTGEGDGTVVGDRVGMLEESYETAEHRATLARLCRVLSAREREIIRLRFDEDLTQAEIGARVGLSQMHVSRILRTAMEKLRHAAGTDGGAEAPE